MMEPLGCNLRVYFGILGIAGLHSDGEEWCGAARLAAAGEKEPGYVSAGR